MRKVGSINSVSAAAEAERVRLSGTLGHSAAAAGMGKEHSRSRARITVGRAEDPAN